MRDDFDTTLTTDELDAAVMAELDAILPVQPAASPPPAPKPPPKKVDLGKYLHFVRKQGGHGCWAYAWFAAWDIMNEIACPYSPNLAVGFDLWFHRNSDVWKPQKGAHTPDGRWLHYGTDNQQSWVYTHFGCPTEGSYVSSYPVTTWSWTTIASSYEGANEAANYRWKGEPSKIVRIPAGTGVALSTQFIPWLAAGHPIRIAIKRKSGQGHYVTLVGYDADASKFTFVDSTGDRAHVNGFGTYTFDQIDKVINANEEVTHGEIIHIHPPRPVPAARIKVTHDNRMNVQLWLSVSDSPLPRRQIWPPLQAEDHTAGRLQGRWLPWDDNSRNLHYTVRLPSELVWPPGQKSRVALDLYDSGAHSDLGGKIEEFTVAFGGEVLECQQLTGGPLAFKARSHLRLTIP